MAKLKTLLSPFSRPSETPSDEQVYSPLAPLKERAEHWRKSIIDDRRRAIYDAAMDAIDTAEYAQLQQRHRDTVEQNPEKSFTKYLDLAPWFMVHSEIAVLLDLDRRDPVSILDIGSGGGHFLSIAKALGHSGLGFDMPDPSLYGDLLALFSVPRVEGGVELAKPFPNAIGRFDIITMNAQIFDVFPRTETRWRVEQWAGFLDYLCHNHLNYNGEIFVGLNRSANAEGEHDYNWPLIDLAQAKGATVYRDRKRMHFKLTEPLRFPDLEHEIWTSDAT